MKYLCLVYGEEALMATMDDRDCMACAEDLERSGHLIAGQALQPVSTATTVRVRNGNVSVADGPFAETKEQLAGAMCDEGARPAWLGYTGVEHVDATLTKLEKLGGRVLMPAMDIPDVGRLALVADTRGAPFYIMRGAVEDGTSTAFQAMTPGHCSWNELTTADQDGALDFYGALFGWTSTEGMPLSDTLEYRFLDCGDTRFGALSPCMEPGPAPGWNCYFYVPGIDAAGAKVEGGGGRVLHGPHETPGGDYILVSADPDGAVFSLVGPRSA